MTRRLRSVKAPPPWTAHLGALCDAAREHDDPALWVEAVVALLRGLGVHREARTPAPALAMVRAPDGSPVYVPAKLLRELGALLRGSGIECEITAEAPRVTWTERPFTGVQRIARRDVVLGSVTVTYPRGRLRLASVEPATSADAHAAVSVYSLLPVAPYEVAEAAE